jgi:prepilin-type N-terminal cleavage/methylation domain-containing protein
VTREKSAGFTLTELMVVIAILGILAGLSIKGFRTDTTNRDARKIASLMSTAYRMAIADGPVRADVAAAWGVRARTRVEFSTSGSANLVYVYELEEDPLPANTYSWAPVSGSYLSNRAEIYAVTAAATTLPDQTIPAASLLGSATTSRNYFPDGTSDAYTVYLRDALNTTSGDKWRVVAMPLTPAPQVYKDW